LKSEILGNNTSILSCYLKGDGYTSVLHVYVIIELYDDDGRNYRPKHVVVDVMNK